MNILMLHPHDLRYFPWTIRIIRLGQELVRLGHRVTIGYIAAPKIYRKDLKKVRDSLPQGPEYIELDTRARHYLSNFRKFLHHQPRFDLVHVQKCFSTVSLPGLHLAYRLDCPIHYDWDDNEAGLAMDWIKFRPALWEVKIYERLLPRLVDTVSAASEELKRRAMNLGMPEEDIFPAPVGADLETFHPDNDGSRIREKYGLGQAPVVLYMGQLASAAYAHLLLEGLPMIQKEVQDVRLLVVGGGQLLPQLQGHARILGIDQRTIFTDYVPHDEVPEFVAAADVAVAPFHDNEITRCKSPLKVAEYMAAGKAIVASRVGEVPTMLGDSGKTVLPKSVVGIAEAVTDYLKHPQMRREHGLLARKRAEEVYNWPVTAGHLCRAYRRAFEKREQEIPEGL
jgi:glycosyltransferase involved in cell wall biosynthesis